MLPPGPPRAFRDTICSRGPSPAQCPGPATPTACRPSHSEENAHPPAHSPHPSPLGAGEAPGAPLGICKWGAAPRKAAGSSPFAPALRAPGAGHHGRALPLLSSRPGPTQATGAPTMARRGHSPRSKGTLGSWGASRRQDPCCELGRPHAASPATANGERPAPRRQKSRLGPGRGVDQAQRPDQGPPPARSPPSPVHGPPCPALTVVPRTLLGLEVPVIPAAGGREGSGCGGQGAGGRVLGSQGPLRACVCTCVCKRVPLCTCVCGVCGNRTYRVHVRVSACASV